MAGRGSAVVLLHDDYTLAFPDRVTGLVLGGAVISGYGYSDHFRERGRRNMAPLSEGDVEQTLSNWVADRYLLAAGDPAVRMRLREMMAPYARKRVSRARSGTRARAAAGTK